MADTFATTQDLAYFMQKDLSTLNANILTVLLETSASLIQTAVGGQRIVQVIGDTIPLLSTTDSWIDLPQIPVTGVTSVTLDGVTLTASQTDPNGYWVRGDRLWRSSGWQNYVQQPSDVSVLCTHGYAPGDQRLQLARSVSLSLCRGAYVNPSGVQSESLDGYSVTYGQMADVLDSSKAIIKALRKQYGRRGNLVRLG